MSEYLLDTDIISSTLRPRPNFTVARRMAASSPEAQSISAITLGELLFGAIRVGRAGLTDRINHLATYVVRVLPFDDQAARVFGPLKAELERRGQPLDEADLRIAAIALARGLILVSGNERHFRRITELKFENWLSPDA